MTIDENTSVEHPERLTILANTELLAHLPEGVLREVARHCEARTLEVGETVFEEGDASGFVIVVAAGLLDAFKRNDSGEPVWLRSVGPGDMAARGAHEVAHAWRESPAGNGADAPLQRQPGGAAVSGRTRPTIR